jgi:hypothetical protein
MELLTELNLIGQPSGLQVVNFHPQALHDLYTEGSTPDASNFSVRSPHPTFHLLREEDLLKAGLSYGPKIDDIPEKNADKLRGMGYGECEKVWKEL